MNNKLAVKNSSLETKQTDSPRTILSPDDAKLLIDFFTLLHEWNQKDKLRKKMAEKLDA